MFVDELARARVGAKVPAQRPLVVDVLVTPAIDDQPVRLAVKEVADQPGHAPLTDRFIEAVPGIRVDVDLNREPSDLVCKLPAASWLLLLEVQFALAGQMPVTRSLGGMRTSKG